MSRAGSIAIIGSGPAGIITAYTLLQDGFSRVQILTRDSTPGGVWATERVYPGLQINNVHGEYRFSALEMRPSTEGGRLMGHDLRVYMEAFSDKFRHVFRFDTEVVNIRRDEATSLWLVTVQGNRKSSREVLEFSRVVLCTGGCSTPKVPQAFSVAAAKQAGFKGPIIHSRDFASRLDTILETATNQKSIIVVGGGKSAQDMAAHLANEGRKVTIVFETANAFLASPRPLPAFIRKSRLLSILSGHIVLRSRLERFLHTTRIGSKITSFFWSMLSRASLAALSVTKDSPLHNIHSLFWSTRVDDEGVPRPNRFHALVSAGKIEVIAPARVEGFGQDGKSVILSDGGAVEADVVLLATGYASSWTNLFDEHTAEQLGISRHSPGPLPVSKYIDAGNYYSLKNPPPSRPASEKWASSIYNGIVPAKNIARRDFAINGAVFTTNVGYTCEVVAHWISSYFLGDKMDIPRTPEEAYEHIERNAAWVRKRHPGALVRVNESHSSLIAFWTWPQYTDQLLEEMGLRSMRSGGNWLTWPFKVIDVKEIGTLAEERREKRARWQFVREL
ncbi:FAD/NAD-P-binding domain-containing protein [Mycena albidolilacea]|uniref:FAD/NAD-P-binding domain-containing protein n=1 Tax=Mycena albidolilacea TaxID=1033008 RepID=A0AAD7ATB8_9AGAR|nr:FAD/NAD-P-binding domain-containing protein [Mycena albidolilacea]